MPISKSHLKKNMRTVDVDYFGDTVRVVYKPSEITPTVLAEMNDAAEEGDHMFTPSILARALVSWDLAEDESDLTKIVPIVFDELKDLESPFLATVLTQITEDMFPKKKTGRR